MSLDVDARVRQEDFELDAAFAAEMGETVALLGPNGAGKSTVVRVLAGLQDHEGTDALSGAPLDHLPPNERPIGIVFQDLLLFPHLSAAENAAFPLRARRVARAEALRRATELLRHLGFPDTRLSARPADLSGGEQQRVALARALIAQPTLLLLDEPTASLDVQARARLRTMIRETMAAFPGVRILVTHDPVEAMTLADRIVVLEKGQVSQAGTPAELRESPRTPYVAELVGLNLYVGRLEPLEPGAGRLRTPEGDVIVAWPPGAGALAMVGVLGVLRPADVSLHVSEPEGGSARNVFRGIVEAISIEGERARVRLATSPPVVAEVTLGSVGRLGLREGRDAWASFKAVEVSILLP